MYLNLERVFELHEQGLSTGDIALAMGLPRNRQSRKRIRSALGVKAPNSSQRIIRAILRGDPPKKPKHLKSGAADKFINKFEKDKNVRRSTGHKFYSKRRKEVRFIKQFEDHECKFSDSQEEFLSGLDLSAITAEQLFKLREIYGRKKKIFG